VHKWGEPVKSITRLSIVLIAIALTLPLWSAPSLILFVQPERAQIRAGELHNMFSYENSAHETGFGRLAISIISLLILLIPYRRGERWAYAALVIFAVVYYVPVFLFGALPTLGTWPVFRSLPQPRSGNLAWQEWSIFAVNALLVFGLAMSAPVFFRRKA